MPRYDVSVMVNGETLAYADSCHSEDKCVVRGADLAVSK